MALDYYKQAFGKGNERAGENMKRLTATAGSSDTAAGAPKPEPKKATEEKPASAEPGTKTTGNTSGAAAAAPPAPPPPPPPPKKTVKTDSGGQ